MTILISSHFISYIFVYPHPTSIILGFVLVSFAYMCSKYGSGIVMSEGMIYLRLRIMLLVGMSGTDVLSVMLARGVMCDVRHPRQEEAL